MNVLATAESSHHVLWPNLDLCPVLKTFPIPSPTEDIFASQSHIVYCIHWLIFQTWNSLRQDGGKGDID